MDDKFTKKQLERIDRLVEVYDWSEKRRFELLNHCNQYGENNDREALKNWSLKYDILNKRRKEAEEYFEREFKSCVYILFPDFQQLFFSLRTSCRNEIYPEKSCKMIKGK